MDAMQRHEHGSAIEQLNYEAISTRGREYVVGKKLFYF